MPLPPLKPMAQSRHGVVRIGESTAYIRPLVVAIPRFIQIELPY
jgi:hypothetical protein